MLQSKSCLTYNLLGKLQHLSTILFLVRVCGSAGASSPIRRVPSAHLVTLVIDDHQGGWERWTIFHGFSSFFRVEQFNLVQPLLSVAGWPGFWGFQAAARKFNLELLFWVHNVSTETFGLVRVEILSGKHMVLAAELLWRRPGEFSELLFSARFQKKYVWTLVFRLETLAGLNWKNVFVLKFFCFLWKSAYLLLHFCDVFVTRFSIFFSVLDVIGY